MERAGSDLVLQIRDRHSKAKIYSEHLIPGRVLSLGRGPGNDIVLSSPYVSRFHMVISWKGEYPTIVDLSSKNGTTLNGLVIGREAGLRAGDVIRASDVTITIQSRSYAPIERLGRPAEAGDDSATRTNLYSEIVQKPGIRFLRSAARIAVAAGSAITLALLFWP